MTFLTAATLPNEPVEVAEPLTPPGTSTRPVELTAILVALAVPSYRCNVPAPLNKVLSPSFCQIQSLELFCNFKLASLPVPPVI